MHYSKYIVHILCDYYCFLCFINKEKKKKKNLFVLLFLQIFVWWQSGRVLHVEVFVNTLSPHEYVDSPATTNVLLWMWRVMPLSFCFVLFCACFVFLLFNTNKNINKAIGSSFNNYRGTYQMGSHRVHQGGILGGHKAPLHHHTKKSHHHHHHHNRHK